MNIPIFLVFYFAQIALTIPAFITTCATQDAATYALYFAHHALDVFLFWSVFFLTEPREFAAHLALAVVVAAHWFSYGNKCAATVVMNRACGYADDEWLPSLKNSLGLRGWTENFHFVWVGLLCAYDIWRLLRGR